MRCLWENLLIRFSVVSLVVLVTVAASIALFVSDRMQRDAITEVIDHVTLTTTTMALDYLEPDHFEGPMAGERLKEFDRWVRAYLLNSLTPMAKVWGQTET